MPKKIKVTGADKEALSLVKQLLESDLGSMPSINALCKHSGLNSDKLKKGFKIIYGRAPRTYQHQLRMQEARRLLETSELPISEIAWMLGYEYASSFCKAFRKFSGGSALTTRTAQK